MHRVFHLSKFLLFICFALFNSYIIPQSTLHHTVLLLRSQSTLLHTVRSAGMSLIALIIVCSASHSLIISFRVHSTSQSLMFRSLWDFTKSESSQIPIISNCGMKISIFHIFWTNYV